MKNTYIGLFLTSLAALMLEILLTRVFSVATWYYFAFFAISVAMFGFTVGALAIYIFKDFFSNERLLRNLTVFALLFAFAVDISLVVFLSIPFYPRLTGVGVLSTIIVYLSISSPFLFAGVVVGLCLTRFPGKVGLFYAADLVGAAIGAFMVFPVLNAMDAPTAIFLVGAVGALGAIFFAKADREKRAEKENALFKGSSVAFVFLTLVMLVNYAFQPVKVEWVKNAYNVPESESWNTISRIAVYPLKWVVEPYSWGLSTTYKAKKPIGQRMLDMDGVSETPLTLYDGTPESIEHIKYDVTSIAHYLREDANVFVIGVGGGRDILAFKAFNQKSVVGAEINGRIIEMVTGAYGDFTGHFDRWDGVTILNDEARSAITRMDKKFDIIQASCIATWSATTAGAFSLAENSLYTVEAWKIFFDHLTPTGILSFNRWYSPDYPAQLMRLTSLAAHTLKEIGVEDPGKHIAVVRSEFVFSNVVGNGGQIRFMSKMPSATILVSKAPFTETDLNKLRSASEGLRFTVVYDPSTKDDLTGEGRVFKEVIDNVGNDDFHSNTALDITPPTDDRPFFFHMLRLADYFQSKHLKYNEQRFNLIGISMLYILLAVSVCLSLLFIIVPLLIVRDKVPLPTNWGVVGLFFFASIGFGYLLVEISQLQRLIIFLGHPIYSITVVLFSMLFASGLGAMASNVWMKRRPGVGKVLSAMVVLLALIVFFIYAQPGILRLFEQGSIFTRVSVSLAFLLPLGFLMGLPFPIGMEVAQEKLKEHTPWFWAINGATGVVASVLSVCVSIAWGFTATLTIGLFCYISAAVFLSIFLAMGRRAEERPGL